MPTGNAIVDRAIEAHGGEDRFRRVGALDLTWTFRGMMFKLRLRESQLHGRHALIRTDEPRVTIVGYPGPGASATFTPSRTEIDMPGAKPSILEDPRASFRSPRSVLWWTDHEMLYFAGYVLWNYAQLPFLLLRPGLAFHAAETTSREGETWDKVTVDFPEAFPTHSPRQTFYFGPDGLLRRHDYHVGVLSRLARGARYVRAYQEVGGLKIPSRIEIKLGARGESYVPWPSLGFVDLDSVTLVPAE